jgi:precorrin-2/cobalt-factor-2 C20-methyltransferase
MTAPGRLYGVGVGPGDPELMTLKAARLITAAPVLAYFCKQGHRGHGRAIVDDFISPGTIEVELAYPMTIEVPAADEAYHLALKAFYDRSCERLSAHLDAGRDVVVVSEGDPFFYGSFMPIFHRLSGRYETEVVAGVSGMAGCWTRAGTPITYGDDVLAVLPGTLSAAALGEHLARVDAAVIMKLGRNLPKVRRALERSGHLARAMYVERGTMKDAVVMRLADKADDCAPYFAIVLVPGWEGRS